MQCFHFNFCCYVGCERIFKLEELRLTSQHCPLSTGSGPAFIKGSQPSVLRARVTRARAVRARGTWARRREGQGDAGPEPCGPGGPGPGAVRAGGRGPGAVWARGMRVQCRVEHSHPESPGWVSPRGNPGVGGAGGLNESSVVF